MNICLEVFTAEPHLDNSALVVKRADYFLKMKNSGFPCSIQESSITELNNMSAMQIHFSSQSLEALFPSQISWAQLIESFASLVQSYVETGRQHRINNEKRGKTKQTDRLPQHPRHTKQIRGSQNQTLEAGQGCN